MVTFSWAIDTDWVLNLNKPRNSEPLSEERVLPIHLACSQRKLLHKKAHQLQATEKTPECWIMSHTIRWLRLGRMCDQTIHLNKILYAQ